MTRSWVGRPLGSQATARHGCRVERSGWLRIAPDGGQRRRVRGASRLVARDAGRRDPFAGGWSLTVPCAGCDRSRGPLGCARVCAVALSRWRLCRDRGLKGRSSVSIGSARSSCRGRQCSLGSGWTGKPRGARATVHTTVLVGFLAVSAVTRHSAVTLGAGCRRASVNSAGTAYVRSPGVAELCNIPQEVGDHVPAVRTIPVFDHVDALPRAQNHSPIDDRNA